MARTTVLIGVVIAIIVVIGILAAFGFMPLQQAPQQTPTQAPATPTAATPEKREETPAPAQQERRLREELRLAIGIDPDTVDPHGLTTTLVANIVGHVAETLLWFDENGNLIPWLATEWEVSEDGLTYTFKLRSGVKFHDGTPLNAEAVCVNFERWLNPDVRVPSRSQLGPVKECRVIDDLTFEVTLEKPYAPFLRALGSYLRIVSPKSIEEVNVTGTITRPVGTGPYKFVSWEKGKEIVLEAFEDYWGGAPKIKRLVWKIIPEAGTRLAALKAGDVDVAFLPPASEVNALKNDPNIKVYTPLTNRVLFIAFLPNGPLADPKVRQALNYAVDKEAIVKNIMFGLASPLKAPVPDHFFGFCPQQPYEYNPEKAKQLLAEAGYPDGFKMVLFHPVGRYLQDKQIAEAIQAYLAEIGVEVELRTMDWPSFVASILKPFEETEHDAVLIGWGPGVADAHFTIYPQFHSGQRPPKGLQLAHYQNPEVDKLLEQAVTELDEEKRKELYCQVTEIVWNEAPWIFLHVQRYLLAATKNLEGIFIDADGEKFFFHKAVLYEEG